MLTFTCGDLGWNAGGKGCAGPRNIAGDWGGMEKHRLPQGVQWLLLNAFDSL